MSTLTGEFEGGGNVNGGGAEELCAGFCQSFAKGAHKNRTLLIVENLRRERLKLPIREIFPESWVGGKREIGIFRRKVGISQSESVC